MELLHDLLFLPERASTFADRVDGLHYFVILTTMLASFAVGTVGLLFFVRYRQLKLGQVTEVLRPRWFVEVFFIGVPALFFLAWFGMGFRDFTWLQDPPRDATDVFVMGKQWMWKFSYPDGPNSLEVLRVPKGRPIRLLLTSRDVIHSFFVPEFRIKQDVLPGRYTQVWFTATKTGRFQILCTEYCGLEHSAMRGQVIVMEPEEFDAWWVEQQRGLLARQDAPAEPVERGALPDLAERGREVAVRQGCFQCHTVDGTPHIGPTWLDLYLRLERLQTGEQVLADEAYLTRSMMQPRAQVVAGFEPVMPSYLGRLDMAEVAALLEYIRALRSDRPQRGDGRSRP